MEKQFAIEMLGGTPQKAAKAMGYKSVHAIYMWPEKLSQAISDQVVGARERMKKSRKPAKAV